MPLITDLKTAQDFVSEGYEKLLNRGADPSALAHYVPALLEGRISPIDFCWQITSSTEFLSRTHTTEAGQAIPLALTAIADHQADPRYAAVKFEDAFPRPEFEALYHRVEAQSQDPAFVEYCRLHKDRFRQSYGLVRTLCWPGDRVLEVGTSPATSELAATGVHLVTVDHPSLHADYHGKPNPIANSARHVSIDLNHQDLRECLDDVGEGVFKLILFAEIIAYLLISPHDQVRMLATALEPGGYLFISTPNFFSHERLRRMRAGQHPLDMIPQGHTFMDGRHEVREFTMEDLIALVTAQGLQVHSYGWSDCWDAAPAPGTEGIPVRERTNLNLIARKPM